MVLAPDIPRGSTSASTMTLMNRNEQPQMQARPQSRANWRDVTLSKRSSSNHGNEFLLHELDPISHFGVLKLVRRLEQRPPLIFGKRIAGEARAFSVAQEQGDRAEDVASQGRTEGARHVLRGYRPGPP